MISWPGARQWRILRTIEASKVGVTVAQLAAEEDCHSRTIWRNFSSIQAVALSRSLSKRYLKENIWHPSQVFRKAKDGGLFMTMEVGGLREVMSWVMGFERQAEVLEPEHLRQAVAEELTSTVEKYVSEPAAVMEDEARPKTWG